MKTILITAYAINPYKGSEDGTGWNWVLQLARYNRVIAITRENNLPEINRYLDENPIAHSANMQFVGFDLPYYLRFWKRGGFGALPYFYLWQVSLPGFIRKQNLSFDLVHNLNFHNDWIPSFLWKLKKPFIWGPVGHHPKVPKDYLLPVYGWKTYLKDRMTWMVKKGFWLLSPALKKSVREAKSVLTINSEAEKALKLNGRAKLMPAVGAPLIKKPEKIWTKDFRVLSVGRFVPLKGFDMTLRAFAEFYRRLSPEQQARTRLSLVGKGPLKEWLVSLSEKLLIAEAVDFISWMPQSEFKELYRQTEVFLFPSHEGAGMVVPEAFANGVPVVCFDNSGPGEFVTETSGLKAPYGQYGSSVEAFASHLLHLFHDRDHLKRLSEGARERFETWFDWEVKGRIVNQLYENIIQ